jgi:hypothetical protein
MDVNSDYVEILEKMDEQIKSYEKITDLELEVKLEKPDEENIKTEVFDENKSSQLSINIGEKQNNQDRSNENKKIKIEFAENSPIPPITVVIEIEKLKRKTSTIIPLSFSIGQRKMKCKNVSISSDDVFSVTPFCCIE